MHILERRCLSPKLILTYTVLAIATLALSPSQAISSPIASPQQSSINPANTYELRSQFIMPQEKKELEQKSLVCPIDYWHEVSSEKVFESYIYEQIKQDYFFVSMKQLADYFYDGIQAWPDDKKPRVITLDDGLLSQFDNALPVLQRWQIPATFFVMPDYQGDKVHKYMNNSHFQILAQSGQEVASHTMDHRQLNRLRKTDKNAWEDEIIMSQKRLEEITGIEVVSFSTPYGQNGLDKETTALVSQYYKIAVSTGGDIPNLRSSKIHELPRGWKS